jgi:hypothetical protein
VEPGDQSPWGPLHTLSAGYRPVKPPPGAHFCCTGGGTWNDCSVATGALRFVPQPPTRARHRGRGLALFPGDECVSARQKDFPFRSTHPEDPVMSAYMVDLEHIDIDCGAYADALPENGR